MMGKRIIRFLKPLTCTLKEDLTQTWTYKKGDLEYENSIKDFTDDVTPEEIVKQGYGEWVPEEKIKYYSEKTPVKEPPITANTEQTDAEDNTEYENQKPNKTKTKKTGKEPKKPFTVTSKVIFYGDTLYEQIYEPKRKQTYYLGWDSKKQQAIQMDFIEDSYRKYYPITDREPDQNPLETGAVLLPTGIEEYGDIKTLEQEINDFICCYLDITDEHRQQAVWYIMLSWVYENLPTIPYLRIFGDYGTGKTRYLNVIGGLCYKPMFVGGSVRAPPIYRIISRWRGTAVFDEFVLHKSDETEDIIQILNNGYEKGKPVLRCSGDNYDNVKIFDPFCPKVISSRKQFNDRALESRCITEIAKETNRNDIPIILTKTFFEKQQSLRNKLLLYRFHTWNKIDPEQTVSIDFGAIQPRIKQTYIPFTVLFQHDANILQHFKETVTKHNAQIIEDNSTTIEGVIINCYLEFLKNYDPVITAAEIRNKMVNFHGFRETTTANYIGKQLKALGFISKSKKIDGKTQRTVTITEDRLKHLIYKYIPTEDQEPTILEVCKEGPQKKLPEGEKGLHELQQLQRLHEQGGV